MVINYNSSKCVLEMIEVDKSQAAQNIELIISIKNTGITPNFNCNLSAEKGKK